MDDVVANLDSKQCIINTDESGEIYAIPVAVKRNVPNKLSKEFNQTVSNSNLEIDRLDYRYPKYKDEIISYCIDDADQQDQVEDKLQQYLNVHKNNNEDELFNQYKVRIQDIVDPLLNCHDNCFITSIFKINESGNNCKIKTEINNLSRTKYYDLYNSIESIFDYMLPMFSRMMNRSLVDKRIRSNHQNAKLLFETKRNI